MISSKPYQFIWFIPDLFFLFINKIHFQWINVHCARNKFSNKIEPITEMIEIKL